MEQRNLSENQRQARKLFQNFITTMLYSKQDIKKHTFDKEINSIINESCNDLWKMFTNVFYSFNGDPEMDEKETAIWGWNNVARLYLKGRKSTLAFLEKMIKNTGTVIDREDLECNYHELSRDISDSDFDFCLVLYKTKMRNIEYYDSLTEQIMIEIMDKIKTKLDSSKLKNLTTSINEHYFQYKLLLKSVNELYNEFSENEKVILANFKKYCEDNPITDANTDRNRHLECNLKKNGFFSFKLSESPIKYTKKLITITTDTFYLYRIYISFDIETYTSVFTTTKDKYFVKLIDVSMSVRDDVSMELWKKTELNKILHNVYPFDHNPIFLYPIVVLE